MHLLPLQTFFASLQQHRDFSLGIAEYHVLLEVLAQKPDEYLKAENGTLFQLCKLLWLKPNQNEQLFKKLFDNAQSDFRQWVEKQIIETTAVVPSPDGGNTRKPPTPPPITPDLPIPEPKDPIAPEPHQPTTTTNDDLPPLYLNFQEGGGEKLSGQPLIDKSLLLVQHYVPFQRRQLVQIWRKLKKRDGCDIPTNEIDLTATLQKMQREGYLLQPIYKTQAQNTASLITLIDHKGSMVAFKHLAQSIADTATEAGINNRVYYFRNVPQRYNSGEKLLYVYEDRGQIKHCPLVQILKKHPNAAVLIISDAGTASGSYNMDRINATEIFLKELYTHTLKVAWFNPMPKNRWDGSSAYIIRELCDMFEATPEGLQKAILLLNGKKSPRSPIVFPELLKQL